MIYRRIVQLLAILAIVFAPMAAAADRPWASLARADIEGIYRILRANHPGAVDPENGKFAAWLEQGRQEALAKSRNAQRFADYRRALQFYVNGFRDGHVALNWQASPADFEWPGFLVAPAAGDGEITVTTSEEPQVPQGATLVSCDGQTPDAMLAAQIDPYAWNRDIPQARPALASKLFYTDLGDPVRRFGTCAFSVKGAIRSVRLSYRPIETGALRLPVTPTPEMGLRQIGEVWYVSLPNFWDEENVAKLIDEVEGKVAELRNATVVLDLRGNGGGNSALGNKLARVFWGKTFADYYLGRLDNTFDARVSAVNLAHVRELARRYPQQSDLLSLAARMEAALAGGQPYVRTDGPPSVPAGSSPPPNPVRGKVFLLTDSRCYSACLNFLDVVRPMQGVVQVGQPTGADAVYIDNVRQPLPSQLVSISYGYKVYRHRVRANNQWYDPAIRWPGGTMSDEAVARWIAELARTS